MSYELTSLQLKIIGICWRKATCYYSFSFLISTFILHSELTEHNKCSCTFSLLNNQYTNLPTNKKSSFLIIHRFSVLLQISDDYAFLMKLNLKLFHYLTLFTMMMILIRSLEKKGMRYKRSIYYLHLPKISHYCIIFRFLAHYAEGVSLVVPTWKQLIGRD